MKILVTGASGFTGSHLANALVQRGHEVYGFVRPTSSVSALSPSVHLVRGDLANQSDVDHAIRGMDMVYHIAAWPQWEAQPCFSYGLYGQVFMMRTHAPL